MHWGNFIILMTNIVCASRSNHSIQTPSLRAIGNIVTGDDVITQLVVEAGVLHPLKNLLTSPRPNIVKEACWCISNITAGTLAQVRAVYELGIFPILLRIFVEADFKAKREACWALCNATSCSEAAPEIIRYLVGQGLIRPLCKILKCEDSKVIQVALDGIENILQVGQQDSVHSEDNVNQYAVQFESAGGLEILWDLQSHLDTNIYLKAKNVADLYFSDDNSEINVDIGSGQQFAF
jgi:hypothetical protein